MKAAAKSEPKPRTKADLIWFALFLLLLAATAWGMIRGRNWILATYDSDSATAEWQEWKQDAAQMERLPNVVKRKAPKSDLPPAVILMKDYFGICLVGGLGLTAVLLAALLLMMRGAFANTEPFVDRSLPEPPRPSKS